MKWWVIVLCMVGSAAAKLPTFEEAASKVAVWVFRQYLKSQVKENNIGGLTNLLSLRGMMSPDANPEEHSGMFQGDIVMDDTAVDDMVEEYITLRNAYIAPDTKWPNNTVIWQFNENDFDEEQRAAIMVSMSLIEDNTCVRFRPRAPREKVYVNITGNSTGCFATVGYRASRGTHILNYTPSSPGSGCFRTGTLVHEWMHVLGFYHMHSTHNRDEYVRIVEENILPGTSHFFLILGPNQISNLGVEYDYSSCLHYSPNAFSANGSATIEALQEFDGVMGQRDHVTERDWLRINRHYDCPGAWD